MLLRKSLMLILLIMSMQGCLVFKSVSYEINLADSTSGIVSMNFTDIRSDAMNASDLEGDKKQLFQELLKGDDFVKQMKEEGRNILDRRLFKSSGKLCGFVKYSFNDVSSVENLVYQAPFYYVTFGLQDSIISTNGEVIISEDHKRIVWDNSIKNLQFEWFSTDTENSKLVELVQYLEEE